MEHHHRSADRTARQQPFLTSHVGRSKELSNETPLRKRVLIISVCSVWIGIIILGHALGVLSNRL